MKTSFLLVVGLLLASSVLSWHSVGHLTVARIAEWQLMQSDIGQEAFAWANLILSPFKNMCGENKHPFTECATWADKTKSQGWTSMSNWHFRNREIIASGF